MLTLDARASSFISVYLRSLILFFSTYKRPTARALLFFFNLLHLPVKSAISLANDSHVLSKEYFVQK